MTGRLAWLVIGVVATVTVLASTTTGVWFLTAFRPQLHNQVQAYDRPWTAGSFTVRLDSGSISVRQGQPGRIEVIRDLSWTGAKPSPGEQWDGHGLVAQVSCPAIDIGLTCEVSYTIAVPPGVSVNATTDSGDLTAMGMAGQLLLSTSSGDVFVTGATSAAVSASSDSGDVHLGFSAAPHRVQAVATSGNVSVDVPRAGSYAVHPSADAGNISVTISEDQSAPRSITATSDAGNVTVGYT